MINWHALPAAVTEETLAAQRARIVRFAKQSLRTPGCRLTGLMLLIFSRRVSVWLLEGIQQRDKRREQSPFTYTLQ
jgi:hypothetical protein